MRGPPKLSRRSRLRDLADEDLMALVAGGDALAFELVFERHGDVAFSLAYRMCGQRSVAEDIVQEAFLSLWRTAGRYDKQRGTLRTFVLGVVHNRAVDSFRSRSVHDRRQTDDEGIAERLPAAEVTEVEAIRRDEARHVRSALEELPPEQRRVIELAYFGGFTHTEIAELLGLPSGTVKGRMRLGLVKLRSSLADLAEPVL
jgi:RNA polymerase sigma-70 factor (ECF subfamily)